VLTLSAINSYTGATTISAGTLQFASGGLGTISGGGSIIFNGGTLLWASGSSQDISSRIAWVSGGGASGGGPDILLDTNGNYVTLASLSGGSGGMTKMGGGTLTLTGYVYVYGTTTVNGGTLRLGNGSSNGWLSGPIVNNTGLVFAHGSDRVQSRWSRRNTGVFGSVR